MNLKLFLHLRNYTLLLAILGMTIPAFAQNTVTGTVTDAKTSDALIGANVLVQEMSSGTATDIKFSAISDISMKRRLPTRIDFPSTSTTNP